MSANLLIYTLIDTPRLHYVLQWIFAEQLGLPYTLCTSKDEWQQYEGPKINYSTEQLAGEAPGIVPHTLLHEEGIKEQSLSVNRWKHSTILFYNQPGAIIPFDIFAAVFYLISRYEEYLPHKADKHGRYPQQASVAAQYAFLQEPVVDQWLQQLRSILEKNFEISLAQRAFQFQLSYDVDIAWKYLHKDSMHTWGGALKDLLKGRLHDIKERLAVRTGRQKDPYDCFARMDELHRQYGLQPIYFLLLGKRSAYDKNTDPRSPAMQALLRRLTVQYTTGIHPSYLSNDEPGLLEQEINLLSAAGHTPVSRSRQHYIRFTLPQTYERLIAAGIHDDYSMGYAAVNGFRAGTSLSFPWYNLKEELSTALRIHPFVFMDATSRFYAKYNTQEAWLEWERLWYAVKKVNGTFTAIFHNHLLGPARENKGWSAFYERILASL